MTTQEKQEFDAVVEHMKGLTMNGTKEMQRIIRNLRNTVSRTEENSFWVSNVMYSELLSLKCLVDETMEQVCKCEKRTCELAEVPFNPYNE